jgi:hypothetical protein
VGSICAHRQQFEEKFFNGLRRQGNVKAKI